MINCLKCTTGEETYDYSGADKAFAPDFPPGEFVLRSYAGFDLTGHAPSKEIRRCLNCQSLWFYDYFFSDRPPLCVFGEIIKPGPRLQEIGRILFSELTSNQQEKIISPEEYLDFTQKLEVIIQGTN